MSHRTTTQVPALTRAETVKRRRAELRLTQAQAAELAGVAVTTWRMIESGSTTSFRTVTLVAVARSLDWDADHLLDDGPQGTTPYRDPPFDARALDPQDQLLVRALIDRLSEP